MDKPITTHQVKHIKQGQVEIHDQPVIAESHLTISVNGSEWVDLLCTPIALKELSVGFLFTNGVINRLDEIANLELVHCDSLADIWLIHPADKPDLWQRNSGCAGGVSAANIKLKPVIQSEQSVMTQTELTGLLSTFFSRQSLYHQSGGLHSSALCDDNEIVDVSEDIGRHNTLDKLAGASLLTPHEFGRKAIISTGRISLEMMQKAARMESNWVISHTSPTSASISLAEQLGIGVIGYARKDSCVVYTNQRYFVVA